MSLVSYCEIPTTTPHMANKNFGTKIMFVIATSI
jgi:hypothetical protein